MDAEQVKNKVGSAGKKARFFYENGQWQNEPCHLLNTIAKAADTMKTKQCLPQEEP